MPLSDHPIHTTLPAADLERARAFYESTLGFTPANVAPGGAFYDCAGGTRFFLYPSQSPGTNQATAGGFAVEDIEAAVEELKALGVAFEQYPGFTDERGIAETGPVRSAWFKDTEGTSWGSSSSPTRQHHVERAVLQAPPSSWVSTGTRAAPRLR